VVNAEIELFARVEFTDDWLRIYKYFVVLSSSEYTGFDVSGRFGTGPPVTEFKEHAVVVPTVNGRICPVELGAPASVIKTEGPAV
jgi:hypothetical protein